MAKANEDNQTDGVKSISVYSPSYINLIHTRDAVTGDFYLKCNKRDIGPGFFATLALANKAARKHMDEHPGHIVKVMIDQHG